MRYLLLIIAFFISINVFAQSFEYPKGIYMTYNELMDKKPSKDCEFSPVKRKIADIKFNGGADYDMFAPKSCIKSKKIKNDVFAYSSGDSLFINGKLITGKQGYALVTDFGRFLLFEAGLAQFGKMNDIQVTSYPYIYADGKVAEKREFNAVTKDGAGALDFLGYMSGTVIIDVNALDGGRKGLISNYRFYYVIDQKYNNIKTLDINTMRDFLSDYPNLLKEYNQIELKHDKDVYLKYIQLMNAAELENK